MTEGGYSLADIGALMNNRNGGWGNGYGYEWIWIVLIFFLWGGNAWGRNGNGLTQAELQQGFDTQSLLRGQEGIKNGLCDGFYAMNTTLLQGFNGLGREVMENRFESSKCCCETNRNIDAVRYDAAKNTCDIITNATANTQKILDVLCADRIQTLRDKIVEKDQQLQTAQFALSQQAQTANIVSTLQPVARPAYLTLSPYQSANMAYSGFGFGNACGCGF